MIANTLVGTVRISSYFKCELVGEKNTPASDWLLWRTEIESTRLEDVEAHNGRSFFAVNKKTHQK